jgi:hypothetical protein
MENQGLFHDNLCDVGFFDSRNKVRHGVAATLRIRRI